MKFTYSNPTVIHFGQGAIAALPEALGEARKVLLIYGGGSIRQNGVYDQVRAALSGRQWLEFSGVEPNPTVETLDQAVALIRRSGVDFVLAVGGGSVIDGSKYVVAAACYDGDGWDILCGQHRVVTALPLGAVLTLPATGSESNGGAVISRRATQEKRFFVSPHVFPRFAVLDPDVVSSLPTRQLANGIVDAFVHVCEQYLNAPCEAWVQDGYAETLLRALARLAAEFPTRDSAVWRANLMWAANQALNGLIGAGVPQDWATHMIGHELTARYGIDHARTLAIVLPALLRSQIDRKREKLDRMGAVVFGLPAGDGRAAACIEAIAALFAALGMPARLADEGVCDPQAASAVAAALEDHNLSAFGEGGAMTPQRAGQIVEMVL